MSDDKAAPDRSGETAHRCYAAPPILEAIFEVRFAEALDERRTVAISEKLAKLYDTQRPEGQIQFKFEVATRETTVLREFNIFRHASADQSESVTVRPESVSWSRLAPYEGWENFKGRVSEQLPKVLKILGQGRIGRIGLRYVNRIDVPQNETTGSFLYEDYFNYYVKLSDFFDPIESFDWNIGKTFPQADLIVVMRSATMLPEVPGFASFLLDIDVSCENNVPQSAEGIFDKLKLMRNIKNSAFEAALSDRAKAGFR